MSREENSQALLALALASSDH